MGPRNFKCLACRMHVYGDGNRWKLRCECEDTVADDKLAR
jgi:hypothetical protein